MRRRELWLGGLGLTVGYVLAVSGLAYTGHTSKHVASSVSTTPSSGIPFQIVQDQLPPINPQELVPVPNMPRTGQQPLPGFGNQDCGKILFYYQGRLYQLQPGPAPRNGGNPEFYFMQPYQGPPIPGFPSPLAPSPDQQGQPFPPLKF
jgi:hypothetical protein